MIRMNTPAPPRAMWKATLEIGEGLKGISIPVKLYPAVRQREIRFRMLHDQDMTPVRQVLECPAEG